MNFNWSDLAFGSKKAINQLNAVFIAAPREMSAARFTQLVKTYLPQGNIVLGLAKESYIDDFKDQPQFRTLQLAAVKTIIDKVNAASPKHKVYTLSYFQRDAKYILEKIDVKRVVLVNGSWHRTFHTRAEYYTLVNRHIPYDMVSPFASEAEAKAYEGQVLPPVPMPKGPFTAKQMAELAVDVAKWSFDYSFQTGVALGKKKGNKYELLARTFNRVVPYQGYAMHHGASREVHFTPPNELNFYDTVHAEGEMIIYAQKHNINLTGTTLFINLLPCPICARMFCETDIAEFVYSQDHSNGFAVALLEAAGKKVKRIVQ